MRENYILILNFLFLVVILNNYAVFGAEQPGAGKFLLTRGELTIVELTGEWQEGGRVDLGFQTPDGEDVPAGSWCIHMVERRTPPTFVMSLRKVEAYGEPTMGYAAKTVLLRGNEEIDWLELAVKAGCADAQVRLGTQLYYNDDKEISKRGLELVRSAAEQEYPHAMMEYGNMTAQEIRKQGGDGDSFREANMAKFRWSMRAAQAGYPPAMIDVCSDLLWGATGEVQAEKGKAWCRKAAEAENTSSYIREDALKKLGEWEAFQRRVQERINNMNK